jgi:hypothetical protein
MPFDHEKSRFWKRLLPTNASWWELAAAAITVVFAFRHTAISLFFARFNVSPEQIGMGLTTVALHSAVLVVALSILANWLLVGPMVYIYARFGARADRRLKTRVKRLCSSFKNGPWLAIGFFAPSGDRYRFRDRLLLGCLARKKSAPSKHLLGRFGPPVGAPLSLLSLMGMVKLPIV